MDLVFKIDTFVRKVVTDTREIKLLSKIIVKTEFFKNENLPETTNKRFFSQTSTTRNPCTKMKFPVDLVTFTEEILNEKLHFFVQ